MEMSRRNFLSTLPAAVAGITTAGAALQSTGCAIAPTYQVTVGAGRIALSVAEVHSRMGEQSALILRGSELPESIILLKGLSGFSAVGTTCTHLGCSVRPGKGQLQCPCHGSSYDLTGDVIRGPAQRPLNRYSVSVSGDELVISTG